MEIDNARIEQAIIYQVTDSMTTDGDLERRIKQAVDARIDAHFKTTGDALIQRAVNDAIAEGLEHEYCRIDSFGRKVGEGTSVRKELERIIGGYWNTHVDNNGKPADSSYGYKTRAEWFMLQITAASFQDEMKQHIVNLGGSLKDHLRAQLRTTVDQLLSEVFHVKSEGDQALNNPGRSCIDPAQTGKA